MKRLVGWAIGVIISVGAAAADPTPSECLTVKGTSAERICADLVSTGSASGQRTRSKLKSALYGLAKAAKPIAPVDPGFCASGSAIGVNGHELTAILLALAAEEILLPNNSLTITDLTVMGDFRVPKNVPFSLAISHSVFCGNIDLSDTTFGGSLHLKHNLVLAGPDEIREGIINANNTRVANGFELQGSRFGGLIATRVNVGQMFGVTEAVFGHATFSRAQTVGLALARSKQSDEIFSRTKSWVEENLDSERKYEGYHNWFFASNVDLWDAKIAGELYGDQLHVDGAISAHRLEVGLLRFHRAEIKAADFREIVARNIELKGIILGQTSNRDNCSIDVARRYQTDFVSFSGSSIGRSFEINTRDDDQGVTYRSRVDGPLCLNNMRIADTLDLSGLGVSNLDLSETRAGLNVQLSSDDHGDIAFLGPTPTANFTSLETGRLTVSDAVSLPPETYLSSASIGFTQFINTGDHAPNAAALVLGFLRNISGIENKIVALRIFTDTLRAAGLTTAASTLEFEREKTQTDAMSWGLARLSREAAERLGGYGLKPMRTLAVAMTTIALGALIARISVEGRWFLFRQLLSNPRFRQRCFRRFRKPTLVFWIWIDALVLSFDRLIPLVTIADAHKKIRFVRQPWIRVYFALHALLGLLLAATVISVIGQSVGLRTF